MYDAQWPPKTVASRAARSTAFRLLAAASVRAAIQPDQELLPAHLHLGHRLQGSVPPSPAELPPSQMSLPTDPSSVAGPVVLLRTDTLAITNRYGERVHPITGSAVDALGNNYAAPAKRVDVRTHDDRRWSRHCR
ncbi:hypothetical protein GCM10028864_65370 [Microlunatus parietis]